MLRNKLFFSMICGVLSGSLLAANAPKKLETVYLMNVALYLKDAKDVREFVSINSKCADAIKGLKRNWNVSFNGDEGTINFYEHLQTLDIHRGENVQKIIEKKQDNAIDTINLVDTREADATYVDNEFLCNHGNFKVGILFNGRYEGCFFRNLHANSITKVFIPKSYFYTKEGFGPYERAQTLQEYCKHALAQYCILNERILGYKESDKHVPFYLKWPIPADLYVNIFEKKEDWGGAQSLREPIISKGYKIHFVNPYFDMSLLQNKDAYLNLVKLFGYDVSEAEYNSQCYTIPGNFKSITNNTNWKPNTASRIVVRNGVKSIGNDTFREWGTDDINVNVTFYKQLPTTFSTVNMIDIYLPKSITKIKSLAFCNTKIKKIVIPYHVTKINYGAFHSSTLNEVIFEDSKEHKSQLKIIGKYAFKNTNIENITIPSSVYNIGNKALPTTLKHFKYFGNDSFWQYGKAYCDLNTLSCAQHNVKVLTKLFGIKNDNEIYKNSKGNVVQISVLD